MNKRLIECDESLIDRVLTAATEVHRELGPGLLEKVYQPALMIELKRAGIPSQSEVPIPATYKGEDLGLAYRADIIVANCLLLELKAVDALNDVHLATVISDLKQLGFKRGYLLNYHEKLLKHGIKRVSI